MRPHQTDPKLKAALVRLGVFAAIAVVTWFVASAGLSWMLGKGNRLVIAIASHFTAAAVGTAVCLRVFERGQLADIGLGWSAASKRNLTVGLLGGMGAAAAVLVIPVAFRLAEVHRATDPQFSWFNPLYFTLILIFGAVSEEMLFRGYGFQVFISGTGPFGAILPFALLFTFLHAQNPYFGVLPFLNTFFFAILLGFAFMTSGDLWLPIGLHLGWNWVLPVLGDSLSGNTINMTGCVMRWKIGDVWSGGAYGIEGGLLTTFVILLLIVFLRRAPIMAQEPYLLYKERS